MASKIDSKRPRHLLVAGPGRGRLVGVDVRKRTDPRARFEQYADRSDPSGCHRWTGDVRKTGYAYFWLDGKWRRAHIIALELEGVVIPPGMTVDHVKARGCLYRDCVRVDHLEVVTHRENVLRSDGPCAVNARKTHCEPEGHPLDDENTYVAPDGERQCRICRRAADARRRHAARTR